MKTIDLVYFDAGGGHRAAAQALQQAASLQGRDWRVRLVNLTRVLDPASVFRRFTGFEPEDYYNLRLRRGWTLGLGQELKVLQGMIRLGHAPMVRRWAEHWRAAPPDVVVSLIPNFNRSLFEGLALACPGVPYTTVMTDLADHPPHFWIEPGQAQTFVCGTPRAVRQAMAQGVPRARIVETSGMILRPAFYEGSLVSRAGQRRELGLDLDAPTGIVMFGGHGSTQMLRIAEVLQHVQLIFLCGHNAALVAELRSLERQARHAVVGYTQDVPQLMRAADFFIGKPGPGSLSEAVQTGLPVITFDNITVMPQERYNTTWVRDHGLGLTVRSPRTLKRACSALIADLPAFRSRVQTMRNQALYEVLAHIEALTEPAQTTASVVAVDSSRAVATSGT
jgi:1,2-diacylglycerol 3-beta-galactosyltransferase